MAQLCQPALVLQHHPVQQRGADVPLPAAVQAHPQLVLGLEVVLLVLTQPLLRHLEVEHGQLQDPGDQGQRPGVILPLLQRVLRQPLHQPDHRPPGVLPPVLVVKLGAGAEVVTPLADVHFRLL